MSGEATTHTTGHPLKNVIIGVITTVISATVIYFLGFHNPENEELKKSKQATIDAWNSLQFYENEFRETGTRMVCSGNEEGFATNLLNEYEKIIKNISNIEKEEHVDNRLVSLIDRRLSTLRDKKEATAEYYSAYDSLGGNDSDPATIKLYNNFLKKVGELETQDTSFINNVNKELKKRYKVDFSFPSAQVITPEYLVGNWTLDREKEIFLDKNEKFTWKNPDKNFSGTWSIDDLTLSFKFSDGSVVDYSIKRASKKFMFVSDADGVPHYFCR